MCGIAGIVARTDSWDHANREAIVEKMVADVVQRGPDHQDVKELDRLATFGHTRLAIIDPDPRSNQPMTSPGGTVSIAYNGELYNQGEIRSQLESLGVSFQTEGDTEVVLNALERWGQEAFLRFNGIFAVACYDSNSKELMLACDRFAVKPLYVGLTEAEILFCSDFGALIRAIGPPLALDEDGVASFCALRYVPGRRTVVKNVSKLLPGEVVRFRRGREVSRTRFWRPSFDVQEMSTADAVARVTDAIGTAVRRQTVGDAAYGVLLSGGVDSAGIIVNIADSVRVRAFTAVYGDGLPSVVPGDSADRFPVMHDHTDESGYARLVASHCNASLKEVRLTLGDLECSFDAMVRAMGEPMASIDAIGHFCLASAIDSDIKFLLSGVGADEIFGGYVELYFGSNGRLLKNPVSPHDYIKIVGTPDHLDLGFMSILDAPYQSVEYAEDWFADCIGDGFPPGERLNETLKLFVAGADLPYWELKQADAMYMAFSKEVRVPFLDNDLFELASSLSSSLKWADSREKFILREALRPLLPKAVIDRKKFPSLGTPIRFYGRPWFKERCRLLTSRDTIWDAARMKSYLDGTLLGPPDLDVVYRFVVLDQWLREYDIG